MPLPITFWKHGRLFLAFSALWLLLRHRGDLSKMFFRALRAFSRSLDAADALGGALSSASRDLQRFIYPDHAGVAWETSQGRSRSRFSLTETTSASLRSREPGGSAGAGDDGETVPRSVRRLMKVLATPESLAILRAISAGAAQGAVREMSQEGRSVGRTMASNTGSLVGKFFDGLKTPGGERLAQSLVAVAIREGLNTTFDRCQPQKGGIRSGEAHLRLFVDKLVEVGVSERGRRIVIDIVSVVTATAVPILLRGQSQGPDTRLVISKPDAAQETHPFGTIRRQLQTFLGGSDGHCPQARPIESEGVSDNGRDSAPKQATAASPRRENPLERVLVGILQDKTLVREMVRSVASEAVRTYLLTSSELKRTDSTENKEVRGQLGFPSTEEVDRPAPSDLLRRTIAWELRQLGSRLRRLVEARSSEETTWVL